MTARSISLLLLSGCFRDEHDCDESVEDVGDTDATPAGTAAELLAVVSGNGAAQGMLADDSVVGVSWSVTRGDGSAQWVESVPHVGSSWFPRSVEHNMVFCVDRLEVPVVSSLATDRGELDVTIETFAEARRLEHGGIQPDVHASGSYADATLPTHLGQDPGDFRHKEAFLVLERLDSVSPVGGAGWEGTRETETFIEQLAQYLVEFPVPEP